MVPTILVPTDGSQFSEQAWPMALAIAGRMGGRLHLVRVHEPLLATPPFAAVPSYDASLEREVRAQEERHVRALADRARDEAGAAARAEVIDGPVVDALADYAAEIDADLVVMTTHGRGGFSRIWLGSVADGLVRKSTRPVLLIRPGDDRGVPGATERVAFDHVLIPVDGSDHSSQVIERIVTLGEAFDARYTLLHVVSPPHAPGRPHPPSPMPGEASGIPMAAQEEARAEESLQALAQRLRERMRNVDTAVVSHGQPAAGIIDYAETHDVDLIAMTTHGRSGWSRITLGSVADKVLRGTDKPLVLYRPAADEALAAGDGAAAEGLQAAGGAEAP